MHNAVRPEHASTRSQPSNRRLAVLTSHPIQYYAPLFRELAKHIDLHVFFSHSPTAQQQADAGFGTAFQWDIDLTSGYSHSFLKNVAPHPAATRFAGCDTPEIGERLSEGRFDAVLTLGWHLKSLLQGIWAAKRAGLPVIVRGDSQLSTPRGLAKRWAKTLAYPVFLRTFDAALYVGARNREYYMHYGFPAARLFSSPHCIDTDRFCTAATEHARASIRGKLGITADIPLVLFAGKLVPFKRPLDVIDAIAHLRPQGIQAHMLVAGAGELGAAIAAKASEHNVPLHALGFQNQSNMPAVYGAADVLVLPSDGGETWGLVCNEALACGTPIVVSDAVGCAPDLCKDGEAGRTFPLGDTRACASELASLFAAPPSKIAIQDLSEQFTIQRGAQGIMEAIDCVTSSPRV